MGLLTYHLDELPEEQVVVKGEYELKIVSMEQKQSQEDKPMIAVVLSIPSAPNAPDIFHYVSLPMAEDDEKLKNRKLRRLKTFLDAFGIEYEFDPGVQGGKTGWGFVGVEIHEQYGEQNRVSRFVAPPTGSSEPLPETPG